MGLTLGLAGLNSSYDHHAEFSLAYNNEGIVVFLKGLEPLIERAFHVVLSLWRCVIVADGWRQRDRCL
jgi:hypothetical protein